jgi:hypothetical protein
MKENVWIVITTINYPTKAIQEFARLVKKKNWTLLVVGDTKTPGDWHCEESIFLSVEKQLELYPGIANLIPVKHYCRKNIGYLYAMQNGATVIIDTDDDNLPYENFAKDINKSVSAKLIGNAKWVNIYSYYSDDIIWPRGLPLNYIHTKGEVLQSLTLTCPVQQYLADKDPDVDAIFRLINKHDSYFKENGKSYIIDHATYVPFNSQNTVFFREAFVLMYLPCFVSFRMTDIWRSFVVQRLLKHIGTNLAFHGATVWQDRNEHDLMKDFNDEVIGYKLNDSIIDTLCKLDLHELPLKEAIIKVWKSLRQMEIVHDSEIEIVRQWLNYFD